MLLFEPVSWLSSEVISLDEVDSSGELFVDTVSEAFVIVTAWEIEFQLFNSS